MPIDDQERERRRTLLQEHYAAENAHDLDRIMKTFDDDCVMLFNHRSFENDEQIRWAHTHIGMSAEPGALSGLQNNIDQLHFTQKEIVIEGRLCGKHSNEFLGFEPTGNEVVLPFVAFYRFNDSGKVISERVVMNLDPLSS